MCHFGAWKRKHVMRHVMDSHRQRNIEGEFLCVKYSVLWIRNDLFRIRIHL